jgi:prevent-host-death family protein
MIDQDPEVRAVEAAAARECLSDLVDDVKDRRARVVLQEDGKPVAALISAADFELYQHYLRQRAERWKVIEEIWAQNADIDPDEAERDIAEAIAEMRAEERAKRAAAPRP